MTVALLRLPSPLAEAVAAELRERGMTVRLDADRALAPDVDLAVLPAARGVLTGELVAAADRAGVRLVPVTADAAGARLAAAFGLPEPLPAEQPVRRLVDAILTAAPSRAPETPASSVVAVWGPHGAPGRTTLAIELAVELARGGAHVALVDADAHAPSIALALGLPDEGPGLPAACRQGELGGLDAAELTRISVPLGMPGRDVDVLVGINRPSRWPELSASRVATALRACRGWAQTTVVDVAASLERDEEIVSDLERGPRRNAATLAAVEEADRIVAVMSADPVGVARFLRGHGELRAAVGAVPVTVVVNRLRAGSVGVDARGQIRRALERYAGITDVAFLPDDRRGTDAARLAARPVAEAAPRSALAAAVGRLAPAVIPPAAAPAGGAPSRRGRRAGRTGRGVRVP